MNSDEYDYVCAYPHICARSCAYASEHVWVQTYLVVRLCVFMLCVCVYVRTCVHACKHACVCERERVSVSACM